MGVEQILKIHLFPSVNCWQVLSGFVMQKRLLTLDHFEMWEMQCFPVTVSPVHMKVNHKIKVSYWQPRYYCLPRGCACKSMGNQGVSPHQFFIGWLSKKIRNIFFPSVFLSYLLILACLLGRKCLALSAQTIQHHTTYQTWAELLVSSGYSHIKSKNYWPYLNGIQKLITL